MTDPLSILPGPKILPIYTYGHPVLRKKARPLRGVDEGILRLADDMLLTMHNANGVGLAANQVGVTQRIIALDISGTDGVEHFEPMVLLNPEVIEHEGSWAVEEGCLSLPELRDEVERPEHLRFRYRDLHFDVREIEVHGFLGRVILHEIDHLDGVLFIDRVGTVRRKLMRGRLNKIKNGKVPVTYDIAPSPAGTVLTL
jgi:peptide deformylase